MLLGPVLSGCSVKTIAARSLAATLTAGERSFASDDDPELVRQAFPFSLKTVETLLQDSPRERALLLAASSGFTRYAFGFVRQEADFTEAADLAAATALRQRAVRLYLRGRDYGLRGLALDFPQLPERLRADPVVALRAASRRHVPFLYWTAAGWGGAIDLDAGDSALAADQDLAAALMRRALELDETFELGAIHDFFIAYEGRRASVGGSRPKAREHLQSALAMAQGKRAWPYVTFAELVAVAAQDRPDFERLLHEALDLDLDRAKEQRLSNILAQKRARWLLSRADELFVE